MTSPLQIITVPVTPFDQNARIVYPEGGTHAVLVDPGGDCELLMKRLAERGLRPAQIWLTHSHLDHCGAVAGLKSAFDVTLYAHAAGADLRRTVTLYAEMFGIPEGIMENCPEPDVAVEEGDVLSIGGTPFEVLHTPGHCPDHVSFYSSKAQMVFTGDTLMAGGIGRTDLPGGSYETIMHSLREKLLRLPGSTKVFAGHGSDTMIEREAKTNPFLRG